VPLGPKVREMTANRTKLKISVLIRHNESQNALVMIFMFRDRAFEPFATQVSSAAPHRVRALGQWHNSCGPCTMDDLLLLEAIVRQRIQSAPAVQLKMAISMDGGRICADRPVY
jgi:hypothetical protein